MHHWLNRIGTALARLHGLRVVDLTTDTLGTKPLAYSADEPQGQWASRFANSARHRNMADALEGDVYHGYTMREHAPAFLKALAEACGCSARD